MEARWTGIAHTPGSFNVRGEVFVLGLCQERNRWEDGSKGVYVFQ